MGNFLTTFFHFDRVQNRQYIPRVMEVFLVGLGALAAKVLGDDSYRESTYVDKMKRRFQADPNAKGAFDSGPAFHSLLKKPEYPKYIDKIMNGESSKVTSTQKPTVKDEPLPAKDKNSSGTSHSTVSMM